MTVVLLRAVLYADDPKAWEVKDALTREQDSGQRDERTCNKAGT